MDRLMDGSKTGLRCLRCRKIEQAVEYTVGSVSLDTMTIMWRYCIAILSDRKRGEDRFQSGTDVSITDVIFQLKQLGEHRLDIDIVCSKMTAGVKIRSLLGILNECGNTSNHLVIIQTFNDRSSLTTTYMTHICRSFPPFKAYETFKFAWNMNCQYRTLRHKIASKHLSYKYRFCSWVWNSMSPWSYQLSIALFKAGKFSYALNTQG